MIENLKASTIELYMELCMCTFITYVALYEMLPGMKFENLSYGDYISLGFCCIYTVLIIALPFYIYKRFKTVSDRLLVGVESSNRKSQAMFYPILYMFRRWTFVAFSFAFSQRESVDAYL